MEQVRSTSEVIDQLCWKHLGPGCLVLFVVSESLLVQALQLYSSRARLELARSPVLIKNEQVLSLPKGFVSIAILESKQLMQRILRAEPEVACSEIAVA